MLNECLICSCTRRPRNLLHFQIEHVPEFGTNTLVLFCNNRLPLDFQSAEESRLHSPVYHQQIRTPPSILLLRRRLLRIRRRRRLAL